MADVTIKYKDTTIAEMSESGTKTLGISGKYCEGDVIVEYVAKETGLSDAKRWDITLDGTVSGNSVRLLDDVWLKDNRENPRLCVLLMPKFTVPYSSSVRNQSVHIHSNTSFITDSSGALYTSVATYVHTNGSVAYRNRAVTLPNGNDIGDLLITPYGVLSVIANTTYPLVAGEYVVFAFLV